MRRNAAIVACTVALHVLLFAAGWLTGAATGLSKRRDSRFEIRDPGVTNLEPRISNLVHRPDPLATFLVRKPPVAIVVPPRVPYGHVIARAGARHRIAPGLIAAIACVESDFNPLEVSPKGARGLLQVMPKTAIRFGVEAEELFDPERNVAAGTAYLAWLLDRYDGNLDLALAAYNAGEGAVDMYRGIPPYRETREYVRRVRSVLARGEVRSKR